MGFQHAKRFSPARSVLVVVVVGYFRALLRATIVHIDQTLTRVARYSVARGNIRMSPELEGEIFLARGNKTKMFACRAAILPQSSGISEGRLREIRKILFGHDSP